MILRHFLHMVLFLAAVVVLVLLEHLVHLGEHSTAQAHADKAFFLVGCQPVMPGPQFRVGVPEVVQRLRDQHDRHLAAALVCLLGIVNKLTLQHDNNSVLFMV